MPIFILIFFLASCGKVNDLLDDVEYREYKEEYFEGVDPEIQPYYNNFNSIYEVNVNHIPANFVKMEKLVAGQCIRYGDGSKEIRLNIRFWDKADNYTREVLVFHELGHCFFNREHSEKTMDTEVFGVIPESIMYPGVLRGKWYDFFMLEYQKELIPGFK